MLQKLAAKSVSIAIYLAKTFKKSEALAAAGTLFITQIAPGDSNVGFRPTKHIGLPFATLRRLGSIYGTLFPPSVLCASHARSYLSRLSLM
jgi:hypothetical protein